MKCSPPPPPKKNPNKTKEKNNKIKHLAVRPVNSCKSPLVTL